MTSPAACPSCARPLDLSGHSESDSPAPAPAPASAPSAASIHAPFVLLSRETRELYPRGSGVAVLASPPSPLAFHRDYVSPNLPVLVRGALDDWPALRRWRSNGYLRRRMGERRVSVACTPHGRADSVQGGVLMLPCEERWPFERVVDYIERDRLDAQQQQQPSGGEVYYLQAQCGAFVSEFAPLHADVRPLQWASQAFDAAPDAVNLWLGNRRSLSALHQDSYENLYAVVSGHKTFLLFPPTDLYWLDERTVPVGRYTRSEAGGPLRAGGDEQASSVPWAADVEQQLRDMQREHAQEREGAEEAGWAADEPSETGVEDGEADQELNEPLITERMRRKYGKSVLSQHCCAALLTTLWWDKCSSCQCTSDVSAVCAALLGAVLGWWWCALARCCTCPACGSTAWRRATTTRASASPSTCGQCTASTASLHSATNSTTPHAYAWARVRRVLLQVRHALRPPVGVAPALAPTGAVRVPAARRTAQTETHHSDRRHVTTDTARQRGPLQLTSLVYRALAAAVSAKAGGSDVQQQAKDALAHSKAALATDRSYGLPVDVSQLHAVGSFVSAAGELSGALGGQVAGTRRSKSGYTLYARYAMLCCICAACCVRRALQAPSPRPPPCRTNLPAAAAAAAQAHCCSRHRHSATCSR